MAAPIALVDKTGEAILNAPRDADLAGQFAARASLRENPTLAIEDAGTAFQLGAAAFVGFGTPATLVPQAALPTAAKGGVNVGEVVTKPESLWGKSTDEIAAGFNEAGYKATVRTSRSGKAQIVTVSGHPEVTQVQVHPGGGRHGGAYIKISTSTEGKIKVVDPETYKPTPGEKTRVIPFRGGKR